MLFVFESLAGENAFLDVADTVEGVPIMTSNAKTLARRGHPGQTHGYFRHLILSTEGPCP